MGRKLFCELCPFTYKISMYKGILLRKLTWLLHSKRYARNRINEPLPIKVYSHKSLIRRKLGDVDMTLQENKATNLSLAAPKINGIIIKPGQTFSFWRLVGACTERKGYKEGLVIKLKGVDKGIGGGMCQFTNLLHWMVLHSPLTITEHHHHNQLDMFPDYGRQVPFGSGTSIMYNYLDYQVVNNTDQIFQFITYTNETHLCGELRSDQVTPHSYHIVEEESYFVKEEDNYFRHNKIFVEKINKENGQKVDKTLVTENYAKVLYDESFIPEEKIKAS